MLAQLPHRVGELVKEALAAQVAGHGQVTADPGVDAHDLRKLQEQARGQVVDAEVAHVLKDVEGLRAAGAAHARDHHDVGHAGGALAVAHLLAVT